MGKRAVQVGLGFLFLYSLISFVLFLITNVFGVYLGVYNDYLWILRTSAYVIYALTAIGFLIRFVETLDLFTGLQAIGYLVYVLLIILAVGGIAATIAFALFIVFLAIPHFGENTWLAGLLVLLGASLFLSYFLKVTFVLWIILNAISVIRSFFLFVSVSMNTD